MAGEVHPVPFRTRKLSPPAPMVLRSGPWESRTSLTNEGHLRAEGPVTRVVAGPSCVWLGAGRTNGGIGQYEWSYGLKCCCDRAFIYLLLRFRFLDVRLRFGIISRDLTLRGTLNAPPACLKAPDAEINEQLTKCWSLSFGMN